MIGALVLSLLLQTPDVPLCSAALVGEQRVLRLPSAEAEDTIRRWRIAQWRVRSWTVRRASWRIVLACVAKEG